MESESYKSWGSWGAYLSQCNGDNLSVRDLVSLCPPIVDTLKVPCVPDTALFLLYLCDLYCLCGNYESAANLYTHVFFVHGLARHSHQFDCLDESAIECTGHSLNELVDTDPTERYRIVRVIRDTLSSMCLSVDDMSKCGSASVPETSVIPGANAASSHPDVECALPDSDASAFPGAASSAASSNVESSLPDLDASLPGANAARPSSRVESSVLRGAWPKAIADATHSPREARAMLHT